MDLELAKEAMQLAIDKQQRYDFAEPSPEKLAAKAFAASLVYEFLETRGIPSAGARILDIGHEPYYAGYFQSVTAANLPEHDVHDLRLGTFDAILAMHVLEHSPFPMLALLNIKRSLRPRGIAYVSVPIVTKPFTTDPCHFSVLHAEQWKKLFADTGFDVFHESKGTFNYYAAAQEWRFILG